MVRANPPVERSAGAILDASPDATLLVDADGQIAYANERTFDLFGYDPDELHGEQIELLVPEHLREAHVAERNMYIADPETRPMGVSLDLSARRKDGTLFPVDISLSPIEIDGEFYVITVVRDVSEQETLRTKYRTILEGVPDAIFVANVETGEIVEVNEQAANLLGRRPEELIGKDQSVIHPSDEYDRYRGLFDDHISRGTDIFAQFPDGSNVHVETKDGEHVPVEINAHVFEIGDRRLVTGVFRDIRTRKEYERQLRALHDATHRLMTTDEWTEIANIILEAADTNLGYSSTVVRFVEDGNRLRLVAITEQARDELGVRPDYPIDGGNPAARAYERGEPLVYDDVRDLDDEYDRGEARSAMYLPVGEHGVVNVVDTEVGAFDPSDIELASVLAANAEAVLDRLEYERELERQNERLDEFASVVSHDLRNPLHTAKGWTDVAKEEGDTDHLERVQNALDRMETIIEDTLALAHQGEAVTDTEAISIVDLAEDCWAMVETTHARLEVDEEFELWGDQERLQRVFENLFRNAVEHGGDDVTVRIGRIDDGFCVEDDGPGLPEDDRDSVFEVGWTSADGGTGFGLAIVRRIAQAHGWDVRTTDGTDGGARFEFTGVEFR